MKNLSQKQVIYIDRFYSWTNNKGKVTVVNDERTVLYGATKKTLAWWMEKEKDRFECDTFYGNRGERSRIAHLIAYYPRISHLNRLEYSDEHICEYSKEQKRIIWL